MARYRSKTILADHASNIWTLHLAAPPTTKAGQKEKAETAAAAVRANGNITRIGGKLIAVEAKVDAQALYIANQLRALESKIAHLNPGKMESEIQLLQGMLRNGLDSMEFKVRAAGGAAADGRVSLHGSQLAELTDGVDTLHHRLDRFTSSLFDDTGAPGYAFCDFAVGGKKRKGDELSAESNKGGRPNKASYHHWVLLGPVNTDTKATGPAPNFFRKVLDGAGLGKLVLPSHYIERLQSDPAFLSVGFTGANEANMFIGAWSGAIIDPALRAITARLATTAGASTSNYSFPDGKLGGTGGRLRNGLGKSQIDTADGHPRAKRRLINLTPNTNGIHARPNNHSSPHTACERSLPGAIRPQKAMG
ncbi:hypothetical protein C8F04DRAFT_1331484 [Mycena alexandri]|uniref:Uncharacterized protein n=1 Tax=Mycena alexandri TaxID=1745969 RepID=A0AAD6WKY5_9AGAR|nr:hypothetical protein C8F04DRAFT_1331484 [Mycena alexandri]